MREKGATNKAGIVTVNITLECAAFSKTEEPVFFLNFQCQWKREQACEIAISTKAKKIERFFDRFILRYTRSGECLYSDNKVIYKAQILHLAEAHSHTFVGKNVITFLTTKHLTISQRSFTSLLSSVKKFGLESCFGSVQRLS